VETLRGQGEEVKSTDTRSSLFGGAAIDPDEAVRQYVSDQEDIRAAGDEADYYPRSTYEKYEYHAATDPPLPLTSLGEKLAPHVDLYDINFQLRQSFAKVLQILVLVGLGVLFFSKKYRGVKFNTTTMSVAMAGIGFLTILVLLPILSLDYGLLRAFQQMLIVLALPTVLGSLWLLGFLKEKLRMLAAALLAALFFVCSTGLVAAATGGYLAQLHLHNQGLYYDGYYIHRGEVEAIEWLGARREGSKSELQIGIEADRFAASKLLSLEGVNDAHNSVYPGIVLRDAYVYLGYTNVQKGAVYALHNNEGIIYTYPSEFLESNKNLIYSNGQSKIYR